MSAGPSTSPTPGPTEVATRYFDAWRAKDMDAYRALLADGVDFAGPFGTAHGIDECVEGMRRLAGGTTDVVVEKMIGDDNDVISWFDLHTADASFAVANWTHVEGGRITRIRVTFDPRPAE